jgi:hypothetical protein
MSINKSRMANTRLPDFSWCNIPKCGKYDKWPQNIPSCYKLSGELPDCIFWVNLSKFWSALQCNMFVYCMDIWSFCSHFIYFTAIWYILWTFGIFCGNLVYFSPCWYIAPRKILQPWLRDCVARKPFVLNHLNRHFPISFAVKVVKMFCRKFPRIT